MLKFPERMSDARIMLVNDDGIHAEGIKVLEEIVKAITPQVWVVAPENQHSAAGHSLTLHDPLRIKEYDDRHVSVLGTPTDAALMGIQKVMRSFKPDLVLSGINLGLNTADDVTYSGTISAAMEATLLEVPSIALSQALQTEGIYRQHIDWSIARKFLPVILEKLQGQEIDDNVVMSVNFPLPKPNKEPKVVAIAQGHFSLKDQNIVDCVDPRGRAYFWLGPPPKRDNEDMHVDMGCISHGDVTITPLGLNLTHHSTLKKLEGIF